MLDVLPKVRDDIDAFPYNDMHGAIDVGDFDGDAYILYDTSGLSDAQLMVGDSSMYLISRMDGKNSVLDLREKYESETGLEVDLNEIENMIRELDVARFLDNENYRDLYNNLRSQFSAEPVRPSACAGSVYSDDIETLEDELDILIKDAPKPENEGRVGNVMRRAPRGVIAPHMDFARAAKCYGQVYKELVERYNRPDVVIILGTAHGEMKNRFAVCDKDFEITGGVVSCHNEITQRILQETSAVANFKDDIFVHRSEHSIELQAVWLEYIWPGVKIVPILVREMDCYIQDPAAIGDDVEINSMRDAILKVMDEYRVTILASADLSHIGRRFGDDRDLDIGFVSETEVADRDYLRYVLRGDGKGALGSLANHGDRYHICGTGCIYMLNSLLSGVEGQLLGYYQAVSYELEQAVGCSGIIFE